MKAFRITIPTRSSAGISCFGASPPRRRSISRPISVTSCTSTENTSHEVPRGDISEAGLTTRWTCTRISCAVKTGSVSWHTTRGFPRSSIYIRIRRDCFAPRNGEPVKFVPTATGCVESRQAGDNTPADCPCSRIIRSGWISEKATTPGSPRNDSTKKTGTRRVAGSSA